MHVFPWAGRCAHASHGRSCQPWLLRLGISVPREAVVGVKNARLTLRAGFTLRSQRRRHGFTDVALRDGIDAGDVAGPRMRSPARRLASPGGHCDNNLLPSEFHYKSDGVADGPWAARARVREVVNMAPMSSKSAPPAEF